MKLKLFSHALVKRLLDSVAENTPRYDQTNEWLPRIAGGERLEHESNFVVDPPPTLIISDKATDDAENARRVFTWLNKLTPAVAMELRLWAHLTHVVFPDYMHTRWPPENGNLVTRRYLFEGNSFAALSRNGIARLWWAAYLTRDEKRPDPFELTDILFLVQDIQVALLERRIGKCEGVRVALLEFIRDNKEKLAEKSFGRMIQVLAREVNLLGGVAVLDAVPRAELTSYLTSVATNFTVGEKAA